MSLQEAEDNMRLLIENGKLSKEIKNLEAEIENRKDCEENLNLDWVEQEDTIKLLKRTLTNTKELIKFNGSNANTVKIVNMIEATLNGGE